MSLLVPPHGGGALAPRLVDGDQSVAMAEVVNDLKSITVSPMEAADLVMLAIGGFTPLIGFADHANWQSICATMRLVDDTVWPIPITLSTDAACADTLSIGEQVALLDPTTSQPLAVLTLAEMYRPDRAFEATHIFGTNDINHPGVAELMSRGPINLAGPVKVLGLGGFPERFGDLFMTPSQTRAAFDDRGWKTVAAFQTRNPMHRSHEYLVRIAAEICDGVLVHSLLGNLKAGDIPADIRVQAINTLIDHYLPKERVLHAGYPLDMRYAGPREAILHAVFRQNYGCSHLIVGRDHAGVGDYYEPLAAQHIFDQFPPTDLATQPIKLEHTFWCEKCGGMASKKTCPHGVGDHRIAISGTRVRAQLSSAEPLPPEFTRPEVSQILQSYYQGLATASKGP